MKLYKVQASPIRLGIMGASGRFGRAIAALAASTSEFRLVKLWTHPDSKHLGLDSGLGLPFTADLQEGKCDLYVDVSLPGAVSKHLQAAVSRRIPIVIGVTGLQPEDFRQMEACSKKIPLFYAANFSLGMALVRKFASLTAKLFPTSADIHLIETHHTRKKDAPSGSAIALAESICQTHPEGKKATIVSIRSGETVGKHELIFNTSNEQISLTHIAHRREAFAVGVLAAARFLFSCKPGLYGMDDLLYTQRG